MRIYNRVFVKAGFDKNGQQLYKYSVLDPYYKDMRDQWREQRKLATEWRKIISWQPSEKFKKNARKRDERLDEALKKKDYQQFVDILKEELQE